MFSKSIIKTFKCNFYFFILIVFNFQILLGSVTNNDKKDTVYKLIFEGEYLTAKQILMEHIKLNPTDLNTQYMLGITNYYLNEFNLAKNNFLYIVSIDTSNLKAYSMLAKIFTKTAFYSNAVDVLKKAILIDTTNTGLKKNLAEILYEIGKFPESSILFAALIKNNKQNSSYYYYMHGLCCFKQNKIKDSITSLKYAAEKDSLNLKITYHLSKAYYIQEEYDSSLYYCDRALSLDSLHYNLNKLKGDILYNQQYYLHAIQPYTRALKTNFRSISILKKLGFCYFTVSKYDKAIEKLIQAWKINDQDPLVIFYLGKCYKEKKEIKKAIEMFELAAKYSIPDYINGIYIEMGLCFQEVKDYKNAIRAIKKSLQFPNSEGVAYYNLANLYYEYYADKQVALNYYKKVLSYGLRTEINSFVTKRITSIREEKHFKN